MQSLSVKYRPQTFEEVEAQDFVKTILKNQIINKSFSHAYLFSGKTGSGKTTSARIFANMINNGCGSPIEIDAASNNGVDNIRAIVNDASSRSLTSEYKIYVIDEAHSLTNQSWQALLKTIEEPPEYTIFIFCTTELNKVPKTIINRCQKYEFNAIPVSNILNRLKYICEQEHFTNYIESIDYISKISDGSMRDAISKLDKVASYSTELNIDNTISILGGFSYQLLFGLTNAILDQDEITVHQIVDYCCSTGIDWKSFATTLLNFYIDVEKYILFSDMSLTRIPFNYVDDLKNIINLDEPKRYYDCLIDRTNELKNEIKNDSTPDITTRVALLRMSRWQ